eukprot:2352834-Rhodomonas_salina.1
MSGTDAPRTSMALRVDCEMSGTESGYGATRQKIFVMTQLYFTVILILFNVRLPPAFLSFSPRLFVAVGFVIYQNSCDEVFINLRLGVRYYPISYARSRPCPVLTQHFYCAIFLGPRYAVPSTDLRDA